MAGDQDERLTVATSTVWKYNAVDFDPAAPVIEVEVIFEDVESHTLSMQVDSGADITCIPKRIIPVSEDLSYSYSYIVGYDGVKVVRKTYHIAVRVEERVVYDIEALPIDGDIGLAGRDLLNSLRLTLDGPGLRLLIHGDS